MSHEKRTHALCSASTAKRWMACPGSVGLSMRAPTPPTSKWALEGTKAHELSETMLAEQKRLGRPLTHDEHTQYIGSHSAEMVAHIVTYITIINQEVGAFDSPPATRVETRLALDEDLGMFGICDFLATGLVQGRPTGLVTDLKYGVHHPVHAEGNSQLAYYAAALARCSKLALESVKVVIVQPRVNDGITSAVWPIAKLREAEAQFVKAAKRATYQAAIGELVLVPGDHCHWCPAKSICEHHAQGN